MRLPTSPPTAIVAAPTSTPSLTGPGDCFVCSDPSDTILIIQGFIPFITLIALYTYEYSYPRPSPRSPAVIFLLASVVAVIIHATIKFWMDDWATSHDRPGSWKRYIVYGITKTFQISQLLPLGIAWGLLFWLLWWKMGRAKERIEGSEETVVGEEAPLMRGEGGDRAEGGNGEERRFKVHLNGRWWNGGAGGAGQSED